MHIFSHIESARAEFISTTGLNPNALYLGVRDFEEFEAAVEAAFTLYSVPNVYKKTERIFRGLNLYEVKEEHHFRLAI